MIYLKDETYGIETPVQEKQLDFQKLLTEWGMTDDEYLNYGLCERLQRDGGFFPEMYKGGTQKKDYKDLFWQDKLKAISFFGCENIDLSTGMLKSDAHVIFMVNAEKIKPAQTYRNRFEIINKVLDIIGNYPDMFPKETLTGIDNVFREYSGWKTSKGMNFVDMQPVFCFRFNLDIIGFKNYCKNPIKKL